MFFCDQTLHRLNHTHSSFLRRLASARRFFSSLFIFMSHGLQVQWSKDSDHCNRQTAVGGLFGWREGSVRCSLSSMGGDTGSHASADVTAGVPRELAVAQPASGPPARARVPGALAVHPAGMAFPSLEDGVRGAWSAGKGFGAALAREGAGGVAHAPPIIVTSEVPVACRPPSGGARAGATAEGTCSCLAGEDESGGGCIVLRRACAEVGDSDQGSGDDVALGSMERACMGGGTSAGPDGGEE